MIHLLWYPQMMLGDAGQRIQSDRAREVTRDLRGEVVEQARDEAAALVVKARDGQDFGELARKHSGDPGSAGRGGDLGIIRPGTMTPAFEAAVFALDQGQSLEKGAEVDDLHLGEVRCQEYGQVRRTQLRQGQKSGRADFSLGFGMHGPNAVDDPFGIWIRGQHAQGIDASLGRSPLAQRQELHSD